MHRRCFLAVTIGDIVVAVETVVTGQPFSVAMLNVSRHCCTDNIDKYGMCCGQFAAEITTIVGFTVLVLAMK